MVNIERLKDIRFNKSDINLIEFIRANGGTTTASNPEIQQALGEKFAAKITRAINKMQAINVIQRDMKRGKGYCLRTLTLNEDVLKRIQELTKLDNIYKLQISPIELKIVRHIYRVSHGEKFIRISTPEIMENIKEKTVTYVQRSIIELKNYNILQIRTENYNERYIKLNMDVVLDLLNVTNPNLEEEYTARLRRKRKPETPWSGTKSKRVIN